MAKSSRLLASALLWVPAFGFAALMLLPACGIELSTHAALGLAAACLSCLAFYVVRDVSFQEKKPDEALADVQFEDKPADRTGIKGEVPSRPNSGIREGWRWKW